MDILIVKLSALGDVIHTLPALTTLRRHLPEARISWLIEPAAADLVRGHPGLDRLIIWPRQDWITRARRGQWASLLRDLRTFVREFRSVRYDLVIDFQSLAKSALWVGLARARRKAGFGRGLPRNEGAWLALNERVPVVSPDLHAIDRSLRLLEALGFPRLPIAYDLPIDPRAAAEADQLLRSVAIDSNTAFVAANPITRWPTKNWEATRFASTLDLLRERGLPVVITGGPADREAIDRIAHHCRQPPIRLDGRTPLKTLAALLRRARVMLTTDTGPMHLAAAVGTPVVALFGPTAPWRTGPYGEGHQVLRTGLNCSPCFDRTCRTRSYENHACMLQLEPAQVAAAVEQLWNQPAG